MMMMMMSVVVGVAVVIDIVVIAVVVVVVVAVVVLLLLLLLLLLFFCCCSPNTGRTPWNHPVYIYICFFFFLQCTITYIYMEPPGIYTRRGFGNGLRSGVNVGSTVPVVDVIATVLETLSSQQS